MLNKALLKHFYGIQYWDIPQDYLCPPIPGRADYIHYLADLLSANNKGRFQQDTPVQVLDIGVGRTVFIQSLVIGAMAGNLSAQTSILHRLKVPNLLWRPNPNLRKGHSDSIAEE